MGLVQLYRRKAEAGLIQFDPAQEAAAEILAVLARRLEGWSPKKPLFSLFARPEPAPRGLWLWGGVGRGKSMLMDLFFEVAPVGAKRRVHFHEFMQEVHAGIASWRAMELRARRTHPDVDPKAPDDPVHPLAARIAREAWLLCFDEFQVTDIADAMILGRLFEELFARKVVMVATSNRHPSELYRNGLNRQRFEPFIARLLQELDLHALDGPRDYRLARLEQEPVYHAPLGGAASAALDRAWDRMTQGAQPRPVILPVQGRELRVERAAAGCARFTFEELCARPLGAADYLAIARRFDTVLLEGVPRLSPAVRDQAARFRNLVDALYETRTKLILSAEAEPDRLYTEGTQAFEFERTASRLYEMRSHTYLAQRREADAGSTGP
jgi:cell division protein ZapE